MRRREQVGSSCATRSSACGHGASGLNVAALATPRTIGSYLAGLNAMTMKEVFQVCAKEANIARTLNAGDGTSGAPVVERAICDAEISCGFGFGEE